jgi:cell division septation protein DedD
LRNRRPENELVDDERLKASTLQETAASRRAAADLSRPCGKCVRKKPFLQTILASGGGVALYFGLTEKRFSDIAIPMKRLLKDHFIPHEGNGHHPHVLKHRVLVGYSVLLVLLKALAFAGSIALPSSTLFASAITPENIIALTNAARQSIGLSPLHANALLTSAAQAKAQDMATKNYFAHTSPEGVTPWYWIKNAGYRYRYSAENLAVHFTEAEDVQGGWMASPKHRANIVDPRYKDIGIGVAVGDYEGIPSTFVVQYFGITKADVAAQLAAVSTTTVAAAPSSTPSIPENQPTSTSVAVLPAEPTDPAPEPEPSVTIVPSQNENYVIKLAATSTTKAEIHLAGQTTPLIPDLAEPGTLVASIPVQKKDLPSTGETLYLTQEYASGSQETQAIARLASGNQSSALFGYAPEERQEVKLFGIFTLKDLDDAVHRTYIFFVLFLATSLLINILVKFRIQKVSVIAHATAVLGLGIILSFL